MSQKALLYVSSYPQTYPRVGLRMIQLEPGAVYTPSNTSRGSLTGQIGEIPVSISLYKLATRIEYRLRDAGLEDHPVIQDWLLTASNVPATVTKIVCTRVPKDTRQYFVDLRANTDDHQIVLGTSPVIMGVAPPQPIESSFYSTLFFPY
jgi:hypothetical protein